MKGTKGLSIIMAIAFVALVAQISLPVPALADGHGRDCGHGPVIFGRYVSAENAYDTSSVHANGSLVGPPIFFATAEVMFLDGQGNVCGSADGFYSGIDNTGVNLGPSLFHGTYTIDGTGRITILTCSDGAPSSGNQFCATFTPCSPVTKAQVGYLQGWDGKKIVTVEQIGFGTDPDSTGFLVHKREWTKAEEQHQDHH
ncbi:MAG TPA: hypothetical protein VEM15_00085 [Thermodesulfobacteriota bacterium]|nr:hypothetical protein [Thermodesulfobacteriota bacterium]